MMKIKTMISGTKSRGFTLIELLLTMSLFSVIFSFSLITLGFYSKITNEIDVDLTDNNIINFINKSKAYCRDNKKEGGYIYFDQDSECITFNVGLNEIFNMRLPEGFTLNGVRDDNRIKIDNRGITQDACSIKFKDRKEKIHCLTMCVGTAYVEIKY
ncbi:type II secretion system protein [Clostridium sp. MT-14]|uniref:Type II secretion system GspH family protein n=1 Tax=Clostridium aromativorans TaxID=2836848 RepID=A0ABS8N2K6_9CLOT|nr:type II secretion system protein [Clostridium aromativorans]MCC9294037.1 type II secretion system GspH family protein [Clostridium aromativorans]CAB1242872.1 Prepilin-type cleavage/methylation domain-containing protein [Clostridiaceae bacterium BL-3]